MVKKKRKIVYRVKSGNQNKHLPFQLEPYYKGNCSILFTHTGLILSAGVEPAETLCTEQRGTKRSIKSPKTKPSSFQGAINIRRRLMQNKEKARITQMQSARFELTYKAGREKLQKPITLCFTT